LATRLPRYELLLTGLLKYTSEENVDKENLKLALEKVKEINATINERKAMHDKINYLKSLEKSITVPSDPEKIIEVCPSILYKILIFFSFAISRWFVKES
jgi:hypothetical protein